MNTFKQSAAVLAVALFGASSGANAYILTNADGSFNISGFDWSSSGAAVITGYNTTSANTAGWTDDFNLRFEAYAGNLLDLGGTEFLPANLRRGSGTGYEYTIYVNLNERLTTLADINASLDSVSIAVLDGTWEIWYQDPGDANNSAGTGFRNGIQILGGTIFSSALGSDTILAAQGLTNPGNITLGAGIVGDVTFQNLTYIAPEIDLTEASTTLQFGTNVTSWTMPVSVDGTTCPTSPNNTSWCFQVDANQAFSSVPEPASLALLGLGFLGMGAVRRRTRLVK